MKKLVSVLLVLVLVMSTMTAAMAAVGYERLGIIKMFPQFGSRTMEVAVYMNKGSRGTPTFTAAVDNGSMQNASYTELGTDQIGCIIVVDASLPYCNSNAANDLARGMGQYLTYENTHRVILDTMLNKIPSNTPVKFYVAGNGSKPTVTDWMSISRARSFIYGSIRLTTDYRSCINNALTMAYQEANEIKVEYGTPLFKTVMTLVNPYNVAFGTLPERPDSFPFMLVTFDQHRASNETGDGYINRMAKVENMRPFNTMANYAVTTGGCYVELNRWGKTQVDQGIDTDELAARIESLLDERGWYILSLTPLKSSINYGGADTQHVFTINSQVGGNTFPSVSFMKLERDIPAK